MRVAAREAYSSEITTAAKRTQIEQTFKAAVFERVKNERAFVMSIPTKLGINRRN
jgi:hypothetical protein